MAMMSPLMVDYSRWDRAGPGTARGGGRGRLGGMTGTVEVRHWREHA